MWTKNRSSRREIGPQKAGIIGLRGYISPSKRVARENPSNCFQDFDILRHVPYPAVRHFCCAATKHLMLLSGTVL
ncbi:hypothetical protein ATY79_11640 [Rhizobium sp. R693]|nr:hypothetical protein ATY79_11640 [Rhizobium sp. R693]